MEKYLIDFEEFNEEDFYEALEDEANYYVEENYDELLDECYEEVHIGCCTFYASQILKECDPIAYNCGISDEQSRVLEDAKYELETSGETEINGKLFQIEEDDEEDDEEDE